MQYVSVKFLTELLVITALYVFPFERRPKFFVKLPLCLAVCYAFSYFTSPVFLRFYEWTKPLYICASILRYMALFTLVVLAVYALFDLGLRASFFSCAGSYAIQHLVMKVHSFIEGFYLETAPLHITVVLYTIYLVFAYAVAYFLIIRRLQKEDAARLKANDTFIVNLLIVISFIVLSVFAGNLEATSVLGDISLMGYGVICSVFLLTLQLRVFQKSSILLNERIPNQK